MYSTPDLHSTGVKLYTICIMFGLGKHGPDGRYGVLLDIGSGSVGVAIVSSDPLEEHPEILWTHREVMHSKVNTDQQITEKNISTALVNALLELGGSGLQVLAQHESGVKIKTLQVTVSAPWSYTITKSVSLDAEEPFLITEKLIAELIENAEKKALEIIDENGIAEKLDLEVISKATIEINANGYTVHNPVGKEVGKITLSQVSGLAQKSLLNIIRDEYQKIIPDASLVTHTFIYVYYLVLHQLKPDTSEICLIDITAEATEIGIVRDGVLRYVTHIPVGTADIARNISNVCELPYEEALGYLRSNNVSTTSVLSEKKTKLIDGIISDFETELAELFTRTGDTLSIPKTVFLHSDALTEAFFSERVEKAAKAANHTDHVVHPITAKFLTNTTEGDTALALSAYVFHKKLYNFNYLAQ